MARPTTTASGQRKRRVSVRLDPVLRDWAESRGINLSEVLAKRLSEMRSEDICSGLSIEDFLHG